MNSKTWTTILAIAVLTVAAIYIFSEKKTYDTPTSEPTTYNEIIGGEEVELEYPFVQSLSNPESNEEIRKQNEKEYSSRLATSSYSSIAKPLILGFYYFKNIREKGVDACIGKKGPRTDSSSTSEFPEYNENNFQVQDITYIDKNVYISVDADESPDGLCATIAEYKNLYNNIYDAIHVIVE